MHSDGIADHRENGRDAGMFALQGRHGGVARREQNIRLQRQQFAGIGLREIGIATRNSIVDLEIAAGYPPLLRQSGFEPGSQTRLGNEGADTPHTALGAGVADACEHRKTERELPPPHTFPLDSRCTDGIAPQKQRKGASVRVGVIRFVSITGRPVVVFPDKPIWPWTSDRSRTSNSGSRLTYSITSSASASKVGGTTMPSAVAVF